ncbi:MAG TPA: hypothetical protein VKR56_09235 [Candidatus Cybelea sp.]|nr:hypothetical protein [Candidatus Cybelea sp.]
MMRTALATLCILFVTCAQVVRADTISDAAPADEYFGPAQQSVLEIRNRLDDYDKRDNRAMLDSDTTSSLNHLELAIFDWQHKYPRDPWLPRMLSHLVREYWRAGQSSSDAGSVALALMRTSYGDSPWTTATVAIISQSTDEPAAPNDGAVPVADDGAGPPVPP